MLPSRVRLLSRFGETPENVVRVPLPRLITLRAGMFVPLKSIWIAISIDTAGEMRLDAVSATESGAASGALKSKIRAAALRFGLRLPFFWAVHPANGRLRLSLAGSNK